MRVEHSRNAQLTQCRRRGGGFGPLNVKFYEAYFLGKPLGNVPKLIYQQVSYAIRPLGLLARRRDVFQRVKPSIANGADHRPKFANFGLHLSCYWRLRFNYGGHINP
jgi:hypothetical protein